MGLHSTANQTFGEFYLLDRMCQLKDNDGSAHRHRSHLHEIVN